MNSMTNIGLETVWNTSRALLPWRMGRFWLSDWATRSQEARRWKSLWSGWWLKWCKCVPACNLFQTLISPSNAWRKLALTPGWCLISLVVTTSMKTKLSALQENIEQSKTISWVYAEYICLQWMFRGLGTEVCRRSEELAVDLGCTHTYAVVTGVI